MDYFRVFKSPSVFAQECLFFTDGLGHLKSKDFMIDREGFNNNLIMFVLSGKLHVEQNGHHILKKGEGILLRLMDKHKYYTDESDICEILWMHFNGRQADFFLNLIKQTDTMPVLFVENRVENLIRACFSYFQENTSEREFLVSQAIYQIILIILYTVSNGKNILVQDIHTEFMNKAINYVDENIYNKIKLENFAKQFSVSSFHFCRIFNKYFGKSPMNYILQKKIEISKYMLDYTHEPISSIASSLNFTDQSHFSKSFKNFEKESPLAYRKRKK